MSKTLTAWLNEAGTAILVVCAVIVTGLVVRRELGRPLPEPLPKPRAIAGWPDLARAGHPMGSMDAPVTIIEFSDFQCPFCAAVQVALHELRSKYPTQLRVVYRHFPLEAIHPFSLLAAVASECAAAQGAFEPFHDSLFARQDSNGVQQWTSFAVQSGVSDTGAFHRCLDTRDHLPAVREDAKTARAIGIPGTPGIIVQGTLLPGTPTAEEIDGYIRRALGRPAAGTGS